jgi:hypothetical protein
MKHLVLLAATLGVAAMTAQLNAADLLRVAGVGHGAGYHADNGCSTCAKGGGGGPGAGYGGYAGCCGADYPQMCCEDVWAGYCDEPRCHFWSRLHARLTTDRSCGAACAPACCPPPEYGINRLKKLFHCTPDCCVEEEPSCEAETVTAECCEPCCGHKGIFGWLRRACGGASCSSDVCTECTLDSTSEESSPLPPAPPAESMSDPL